MNYVACLIPRKEGTALFQIEEDVFQQLERLNSSRPEHTAKIREALRVACGFLSRNTTSPHLELRAEVGEGQLAVVANCPDGLRLYDLQADRTGDIATLASLADSLAFEKLNGGGRLALGFNLV